MRAPRRPVKMKTAPKRAKPDIPGKLRVEPSGFVVNEWLETLSRVKRDQPRRYVKEVSAGLQVTVSKYEELKEEHGRRQPSRVAEGEDANAARTTRTRLHRPYRAAG
jgi:hypothetical protein